MTRGVTALHHGEFLQATQIYLGWGFSIAPVAYSSHHLPLSPIKPYPSCPLLPLRLKGTRNWLCGVNPDPQIVGLHAAPRLIRPQGVKFEVRKSFSGGYTRSGGLEVLTGQKAGQCLEDGSFEPGSIHDKMQRHLATLAGELRDFSKGEQR